VTVDWYPKNQAQQSKGIHRTDDTGMKQQGELKAKHLAFMDLDAVWFKLQHFKNERAWHNLNLPRERLVSLLSNPELKKYIDRYYKYRKQEWEADFLEYYQLGGDEKNFENEYQLRIEASQEVILQKLDELKQALTSGQFTGMAFGNLQASWFGQHLYQPLLYCKSNLVEVSPVSLNDGERDFVLDLRPVYEAKRPFFAQRKLYLLRNMSRGHGLGFFEVGNFYPDFILWLLDGDRQYVTFVDPKGLRNLEGPDNPKIRFYRTIKELEACLGDPTVILNFFIIAPTPFQQVRWWTEDLSKDQFTKCQVLFQKDDRQTYIEHLLTTVNAREQVGME